jgi:phosphatidylinositol kinase/protein kinase (PI-3  family)
VGIDFGMAFDNGAGLPIPELMPFRLSRQVQ